MKYVRRQIVTHRREQVAFALRCVGLVTLCHAASTGVYWFFVRRSIFTLADEVSMQPAQIEAMLGAQNASLIAAGTWVWLADVVVAFWFGLRFSHRFYGVLVPVKRLMDDLAHGRFGGQIHLRRDDEMTELKDALNELSTRLAARSGGGPS